MGCAGSTPAEPIGKEQVSLGVANAPPQEQAGESPLKLEDDGIANIPYDVVRRKGESRLRYGAPRRLPSPCESHAASHTSPLSRNKRAMKKSRMVAMAGTCTKSLKGEDRSAVLDSTIDGERVMWGLIADGHAGKEGAETCALELLPWLVEHAVDGSAKALHVAVQAGFKSMHEKVPPCLAHAKTHLGACTPLQQLLFGYSLRPCCTRRALSLSLPHLSLRRHRSARFTAVRGPP